MRIYFIVNPYIQIEYDYLLMKVKYVLLPYKIGTFHLVYIFFFKKKKWNFSPQHIHYLIH